MSLCVGSSNFTIHAIEVLYMGHAMPLFFAQILLLGIFVESLAPERGASVRGQQRIVSSTRYRSRLSSSSNPLQIHAQPLHGSSSDSSVSAPSTTSTAPPVAGVQFAARQAMFDYAAVQGLLVLSQRLKGLSIPDVERTFHVPVLGDFRWGGIGEGSES